jgi:hypothetical protein
MTRPEGARLLVYPEQKEPGMDFIFEWDEAKARSNVQKHKVSFEEAVSIFSDPFC